MTLDVDRISALVASARGQSDEFEAIIHGLKSLATQRPRDLVVFDHDELQIQVGSPGVFARTTSTLKHIEPLSLRLVPVVAALFSGEENDVLVLKYTAAVGEQRQIVDATNRPGLQTMHCFRDELMKLADAGWMHRWAVRGTYYWRLTNKTRTLVLDDWSVLVPLDTLEGKEEILAKISRLA